LQFAKNNILKQLFNISDSTTIDPAQSVLMMELGEKYCCFIILNRQGYEPRRLVYYEADGEEHLLNNVISAHSEFKRLFSDVLINYSFPQSVMTPSKYYNYEDGKKMLQLMYGDTEDMSVLSEHLSDWQLYNVYEVPKSIHTWISLQFHSGKYWHNYSASLINLSRTEEGDKIMIDFKTGQFSVVVTKSHQLQLVRTFAYTEPADVVYYLLKICVEFSITQKDVQLVLSGLIEQQSALYKELYNYFVNISFKKNPVSVKLPRSFDQYPDHFFSSLFNLATCVS
jgi:hypothetical protein